MYYKLLLNNRVIKVCIVNNDIPSDFINSSSIFSIDTEWTGLNKTMDRVVLTCIYNNRGLAYIVRHVDLQYNRINLYALLASNRKMKLFHSAVSDLYQLRKESYHNDRFITFNFIRCTKILQCFYNLSSGDIVKSSLRTLICEYTDTGFIKDYSVTTSNWSDPRLLKSKLHIEYIINDVLYLWEIYKNINNRKPYWKKALVRILQNNIDAFSILAISDAPMIDIIKHSFIKDEA